jgi:hypothetical protein
MGLIRLLVARYRLRFARWRLVWSGRPFRLLFPGPNPHVVDLARPQPAGSFLLRCKAQEPSLNFGFKAFCKECCVCVQNGPKAILPNSSVWPERCRLRTLPPSSAAATGQQRWKPRSSAYRCGALRGSNPLAPIKARPRPLILNSKLVTCFQSRRSSLRESK